MKIATGQVTDGKVIVEGGPLPEGCVVTVLAYEDEDEDEDEDEFDLSPDEEAALMAAMAEADRGELVSWKEARAQLQRRG